MDDDDQAQIERLLTKAREAREHRRELPEIVAQLRKLGVSYRTIFEVAGVPISTAQAWATSIEG